MNEIDLRTRLSALEEENRRLRAALKKLARQVEISGAVDRAGHKLKDLQALHEAKALLAGIVES